MNAIFALVIVVAGAVSFAGANASSNAETIFSAHHDRLEQAIRY